MSVSTRQPTGRTLERGTRQTAGSKQGSHHSNGYMLFLDPPHQVQAVHDAFDRCDVVERVEREVSTKAGSIRRHAVRVTRVVCRAFAIAVRPSAPTERPRHARIWRQSVRSPAMDPS